MLAIGDVADGLSQMRTLIPVALAATIAMVWSLSAAQGFATYSGSELFQRFCAACHGDQGHGDGPVAGTLSVLVPDLTRLAQRNDGIYPAARIRDIVDGRSIVIAHGTRYMPVWGYEFWVEEGADAVAEDEARIMIDRLVDYLQSIQRVVDQAAPQP
jgi:mono/diheme cytochrome c family protein